MLDFLACFVTEADILGMTEAQAYITLPYVLRGVAEDLLNYVIGSTKASEGGVSCSLEAVQHLLRSYPTDISIQSAFLTLRDTRQKPGELETDYSVLLNRLSTSVVTYIPLRSDACCSIKDWTPPSKK